MSISNIVALSSVGISFLSMILSVVFRRKNPLLAKTFEELSDEAIEYGNIKANKYLVKQCKKYNIDLADKSFNCEQSNTINNTDLSDDNKIGG